MKSFSQFLNESYLEERDMKRRKPGGPTPEEVQAGIDAREAEKAAKKAARQPSGAAADSTKQFKPKSTTVASPATSPSRPALPSSPRGGKLALRGTNLQKPPESMMKGAYDAARKQASTSKPSSGGKPPGLPPSGVKPTASAPGKPPSGVKGLRGVGGKALGVAGAAVEGGIEYKSQRYKGRTRAGSLGGASSAVGGGLVGAKGGALTGAKLGSALGPKGAAAGAVIGGIGGYVAGSELGKKAFNTVAGATGKEKAAMATSNRQKQAGTAVKGIGGKTTFDTKKNTITTGSGAQRKTAQLAKTGVVQRGGQSVAGNLAFKGGKAVYKAGPSAQSLAKTSSNPLERIGRTLAPGAYKKSDASNAAKKLNIARQSDATRNTKLGVKSKPAG